MVEKFEDSFNDKELFELESFGIFPRIFTNSSKF